MKGSHNFEDGKGIRVALVFPPAMHPMSPPLGIACLKAFLLSSGTKSLSTASAGSVEVRNFDLNLEYYEQAFQWLSDERLRVSIRKMDHDTTSAKALAARDFFLGGAGRLGVPPGPPLEKGEAGGTQAGRAGRDCATRRARPPLILIDQAALCAYTRYMSSEVSELAQSVLDRCLCKRTRAAARAITRFYDDEMRATGLRPSQVEVLVTVAAKEELSIGALSDELGMDRTTLTRNLRPLEAGGLVATSTKGRTRLVRMTGAGVDHWGRYKDRLTPDGDGRRWLFAHRLVRTDGRTPGGWADTR
jgi:DNA-binding MarR family transcriptional regulator